MMAERCPQRKPDIEFFNIVAAEVASAVVDVGVSVALAPSNVASAARTPAGAADVYASTKRRDANRIIEDKQLHHIHFVPFVLDGYGALGSDAREFVNLLVDHAAEYAPFVKFGANWLTTCGMS